MVSLVVTLYEFLSNLILLIDWGKREPWALGFRGLPISQAHTLTNQQMDSQSWHHTAQHLTMWLIPLRPQGNSGTSFARCRQDKRTVTKCAMKTCRLCHCWQLRWAMFWDMGSIRSQRHFGKVKDKLINLSSPFKSQNRVSLPTSTELQFCGSSSTSNWWFQKYLRVSVVFTLVSHGGWGTVYNIKHFVFLNLYICMVKCAIREPWY